jgi:methyl-accepting chemotaxis protein
MDPAPAAPDAPAAGAPAGEPDGRGQRRVRNFLVDTSLQLRLASYLVAAALLLSIGLGWLLWQAYRETSRVIALGDPEAGDSIALALAAEDRWRIVLVAAALVGVLLCLLGSAVVVTHRIAGPAFAIGRTCRQVGAGDLSRPRPLRSRDLLVDLAADVAGMVEALREREAAERAVALRAAAALRDGAAGEAERGAAAGALERLAGEKAARLG